MSGLFGTHKKSSINQGKGSCFTRGCKCVTGCITGRCSCRRKQKECGEGCQCLYCTNINTVHDKDTEIDELVIEESQGHNNEINDEVD